MNRAFSWCLAILAVGAAAAPAADLSQIKRQIVRAPDGLRAPTYCLLTFGPEARLQKWVILDGSDLYVDFNGNGDLTDPGDKTQASSVTLGPMADADGTERLARLNFYRYSPYTRMIFHLGDHWTQYAGYGHDRLTFASRPEDAPIIHFGGPLTFRWFGTPPALKAGQRCKLFTQLGTPGVGPGSFAAVKCCFVPSEAGLTALLDYPHIDLHMPPIQIKQSLAAD